MKTIYFLKYHGHGQRDKVLDQVIDVNGIMDRLLILCLSYGNEHENILRLYWL